MADDICTIILAAGASSRFGGIKALANWPAAGTGGTLLSQAITTAQAVSPQALVVTGAHHAAILPHLTVPHVHNEHWADGMGSSIACGITALTDSVSTAIILPVDQPLVTPLHLQELIAATRQSGKAAFTQQSEVIGPPIALPRPLFQLALDLKGDTGLKHVLPTGMITTLTTGDALTDVDTRTAHMLLVR